MKYKMGPRVIGIVFTKLLKKYYKENVKDIDFKLYSKAIKKEYKEMILRTPAINNHMQSNLVGASYFFAMAKVLPGMTPALMDEIVNWAMTSDFMMKMHKKEREKGKLFSDKEQDKFVKGAIESQSSNKEMDWKYTFEKGVDEYKINFTQCGVKRLAERENMLEYLPCMCKMDYPKYKMKGANLIRTKTLANGDDCCNFHLERIK